MTDLSIIQNTDIYLLDQILKGRYQKGDLVLDAGCGTGRNMTWFAQNEIAINGCDLSAEAIEQAVQRTGLSADKFKVMGLDNLPYESNSFDHIICSAVLHFAQSEEHFLAMVKEMYRILKPNGTLFIRMTSKFGLPNNYKAEGNGRYFLQDGTTRFLLTEELYKHMKAKIGFRSIEPLKSVLVEDLRSMSTIMLQKL